MCPRFVCIWNLNCSILIGNPIQALMLKLILLSILISAGITGAA